MTDGEASAGALTATSTRATRAHAGGVITGIPDDHRRFINIGDHPTLMVWGVTIEPNVHSLPTPLVELTAGRSKGRAPPFTGTGSFTRPTAGRRLSHTTSSWREEISDIEVD